MFGITKINWKNTTENLVLISTGIAIGAFTCYLVLSSIVNQLMEQQQTVLIEAVKKHSTNVSNDIDNNIDKNKKGTIVIDQQPKIESEIKQELIKENESVLNPIKKKKGKGHW